METIRFTGAKINGFSCNLIAKALFFCSASRAEAFQNTVNTLKRKALGQRDRRNFGVLEAVCFLASHTTEVHVQVLDRQDGDQGCTPVAKRAMPAYRRPEKRSSNCFRFTGLARKALHPASMALALSESKALAVSATIGTSALNSRIFRVASKPPMTGIFRSISTRSKFRLRTSSTASTPLAARVRS